MSVGTSDYEDAMNTLRWAIAVLETARIDLERAEGMVRTALWLFENAAPATAQPASPATPNIPG